MIRASWMLNKSSQRRRQLGQSTVEYILLVTAVIGIMIFFATSQDSGIQSKVNSTLQTATGAMQTKKDVLKGTHYTPDPATPVTGDPQVSVPLDKKEFQ